MIFPSAEAIVSVARFAHSESGFETHSAIRDSISIAASNASRLGVKHEITAGTR